MSFVAFIFIVFTPNGILLWRRTIKRIPMQSPKTFIVFTPNCILLCWRKVKWIPIQIPNKWSSHSAWHRLEAAPKDKPRQKWKKGNARQPQTPKGTTGNGTGTKNTRRKPKTKMGHGPKTARNNQNENNPKKYPIDEKTDTQLRHGKLNDTKPNIVVPSERKSDNNASK